METSQSREDLEQAIPSNPLDKIIDGIVDRIMSNAGSRTVFGDPVREENRTVIPVARVTYRFGFGGGTGPPESTGQPAPGGGGGGGNLTTRPVGFIEMTSSGNRFVPIVDWSQILAMLFTFTGVGIVILLWSARPKRDAD